MTTPAPTLGDDLAEGFEHERRPVQVDFQNGFRRGLRRRDACGMHQAVNVAHGARLADERLDRRAVGDIDGRRRHLEAGVAEGLGGGVRVFLAQVGKEDALARTDSSRNRLPNGAGADHHIHSCH